MGFFNLLNSGFSFGRNAKSDSADISIPSYPAQEVKFNTSGGATSFIEHLSENGYHDLSAFIAFKYYKRTAPVHTAIGRISAEVCNIRPCLYNADTQEYIKEHPLLDKLENPGAFVRSRRELMTELVNNFLLTGNTYLWATGPQNKPPLELTVAGSSTVSMDNGNDGYPDQINVATAQGRIGFVRNEDGKIARYFWEDIGELYQMKTFNPSNQSNQRNFGLSKLTPLYHEIEQYNHASIHNLSLLKRGATMGGIFRPTGEELSDDQFNALKQEIDIFYSGAANSGRPMLAPKELEFENMMQTNKDMDFNVLKKDVTVAIYNEMGIPLPLISPEHMTLGNFDSAREAMYDQTILPLARLLYSEIFQMLKVRYDDLRDSKLTLSFNESEIPALKGKFMRELKDVNAMGITTLDEDREQIGKEPLPELGDKVYRPKGSSMALGEEQKPTAKASPDLKQMDFKKSLSEAKDENGNRVYTDSEIERLTEKYYVYDGAQKDA